MEENDVPNIAKQETPAYILSQRSTLANLNTNKIRSLRSLWSPLKKLQQHAETNKQQQQQQTTWE